MVAGEQAGSHYMLTYSMLAMFYHKHSARIRIVVLDEAFRGVDAKNKMSLYTMANSIGLQTLIANTDFEGYTTLPVTVDVLMLQKDRESLETFIQNYNRRILAPVTA